MPRTTSCFAKLQVSLCSDERALRAGEAMATHCWALTYCRHHERDGGVPRVALRTSWVGEKVALQHAIVLVTVGFWQTDGDDWLIVDYAAHNETRAEIDARRERERLKKQQQRGFATATVPTDVPSTVPSVSPGDSVGDSTVDTSESPTGSPPPISTSTSISTSISRSREGVQGEIPAFYVSAIDTVEADTGVRIERRASWLRYEAHRKSKGKPMSREDAVQWLCSVDVREAKRDRDRARPVGPIRQGRWQG